MTRYIVALAQQAPAPSGQQPGGSPLAGMLVPMLLIFGVIYLLVIRPQSKRKSEHQKMLSELQKGDEVVTTGGIIGRIAEIKGDEIALQVQDGVRFRFQRSAIVALRRGAKAISLSENPEESVGSMRAVKRNDTPSELQNPHAAVPSTVGQQPARAQESADDSLGPSIAMCCVKLDRGLYDGLHSERLLAVRGRCIVELVPTHDETGPGGRFSIDQKSTRLVRAALLGGIGGLATVNKISEAYRNRFQTLLSMDLSSLKESYPNHTVIPLDRVTSATLLKSFWRSNPLCFSLTDQSVRKYTITHLQRDFAALASAFASELGDRFRLI